MVTLTALDCTPLIRSMTTIIKAELLAVLVFWSTQLCAYLRPKKKDNHLFVAAFQSAKGYKATFKQYKMHSAMAMLIYKWRAFKTFGNLLRSMCPSKHFNAQKF